MDRLRVLIADDHQTVREQIHRLVTVECDVVGTAATGVEVIHAVEQLRPDLVILDISMPGMSGIETTRALRQRDSAVKIVFLSNHAEDPLVEAAMQAGAGGYVTKARAAEELIPAIRAIASGQTYLSAKLSAGKRTSKQSPHYL